MRAFTPVRASGSSTCTGMAAWPVRLQVVEPVHAIEIERMGIVGADLGRAPARMSVGARAGSASSAKVGRRTPLSFSSATARPRTLASSTLVGKSNGPLFARFPIA